MISDEPFQSRDNPEMMLYCVLRVLRMPEVIVKRLVYSFDDVERIDAVNSWLLTNERRSIDEIINIKIPGKYNSGIVFFILFMLFAFNLFQDYNRNQKDRY
jgi:hypothetical protein